MAAAALIGIDLAGPTNREDTAVYTAAVDGEVLRTLDLGTGFDDAALHAAIETWSDAPVVGLDAPLSYQPGGGDRSGDRALRRHLKERGLPGAVMAPTMTRMAYLTLRGIAVARLILALRPRARIVETHPGAHLVLAGAPAEAVAAMKSDARARRGLWNWFAAHGVDGLPERVPVDHEIAAVAAARAARTWNAGGTAWCTPADPPLHPFDYCA